MSTRFCFGKHKSGWLETIYSDAAAGRAVLHPFDLRSSSIKKLFDATMLLEGKVLVLAFFSTTLLRLSLLAVCLASKLAAILPMLVMAFSCCCVGRPGFFFLSFLFLPPFWPPS